MTKRLSLLAAFVAFAVVATANSGGYRYGLSDQAFYIPALALGIDPTLFPRDQSLLQSQMHFWLGDEVAGVIGRTLPQDFATPFALLYIVTLALIFAGTVSLVRGLGGDWCTASATLALISLRHRIARTGANSLEGYMHPRMLAFGLGLVALAALVKQRFVWAATLVAIAAVVHPTTGIWFAVVVASARLSTAQLAPKRLAFIATLGAMVFLLIVRIAMSRGLATMDGPWLSVMADRDYLFPALWPAYAWILNLAYPVVLVLILRRRRAQARASESETALVAGLLVLVAIFFLSIPLTMARVAIAVQIQVNRVFWLLDAATMVYLAVWLFDDVLPRFAPQIRTALAAVLVVFSVARGHYLLRVDGPGPLVQMNVPATPWVDALQWLRRQPMSWNVLVDPNHVWAYGVSARLVTLKDVPLDEKDAAIAIYDRDVAIRVNMYRRALEPFHRFTIGDVRRLARRYRFDVFLDATAGRTFPELPVLYRNDHFAIYDLR